jgi:RNA polymerase sigma factor (sigma-70 family)
MMHYELPVHIEGEATRSGLDMSKIYRPALDDHLTFGARARLEPKRTEVEVSRQEAIDRRRCTWMTAAMSGDRPAYERLLRDCLPLIRRVVRNQGVSVDQIDDVVQETLLTLHRARHTFDAGRSFTAWLVSIAKRRAIDWLRRAGRTAAREIYAPLAYENHADPSNVPEKSTLQHDIADRMRSAVGKLSIRQREAVQNIALSPLSLAQAASATGQSIESLRVNWHRALLALRAQPGGRECEDGRL